MNEQWKQLKDTIVDIRDNNEFEHGDVTLMCRFLVNYMEVLEKQMQEPCKNTIDRQAVLDIVDSYSESQSNVEDVTQDIISDIMALSPVTSQPKMGEWISVEDRLPEEGEEVLVWYRYWRYGEYNNWYYTYGIGYQYTGIFSVIDGGVRQSVYAWQELPEQYIVESQESGV